MAGDRLTLSPENMSQFEVLIDNCFDDDSRSEFESNCGEEVHSLNFEVLIRKVYNRVHHRILRAWR